MHIALGFALGFAFGFGANNDAHANGVDVLLEDGCKGFSIPLEPRGDGTYQQRGNDAYPIYELGPDLVLMVKGRGSLPGDRQDDSPLVREATEWLREIHFKQAAWKSARDQAVTSMEPLTIHYAGVTGPARGRTDFLWPFEIGGAEHLVGVTLVKGDGDVYKPFTGAAILFMNCAE